MASHTQSTTESSHMASRSHRLRNDAAKKNAAMVEKVENTIKILDPDNKSYDRTPLPLGKKKEKGDTKSAIKKAVIDRRTSQATGDGSVSRTSYSEERSVSQMESSTSSRDDYSTGTPDEDSTINIGFDDSSDSHSVERSGSVYDRNKSVMSSSDGQSMTDYGGPRGGKSEERQSTTVSEAPKPKEMTVEERNQWGKQEVVITLTETPTIMLYSHQDEAISRESTEEAALVQKKNARYQAFCEARAGGESGGKYQERGVTTLNDPSRCVKSGVVPPPTKDSGRIQVTTWKLYDEMLAANEEEEEQEDVGAAALPGEGEDENVGGEGAEGGGDDDGEEGGDDGPGDDEGGSPKKKGGRTAAWMAAPSLLETVMVVERAVVSNVFEELQLAYRGVAMEKLLDDIPPSKTENVSSPTTQTRSRREQNLFGAPETDAERARNNDEKEKEHEREKEMPAHKSKMKILWRFGDAYPKGKNVSCMAWNPQNADILAAGYGE